MEIYGNLWKSMEFYETGLTKPVSETGLASSPKPVSTCGKPVSPGLAKPVLAKPVFTQTGFQWNRFCHLWCQNRFGYRFPVRFTATMLYEVRRTIRVPKHCVWGPLHRWFQNTSFSILYSLWVPIHIVFGPYQTLILPYTTPHCTRCFVQCFSTTIYITLTPTL